MADIVMTITIPDAVTARVGAATGTSNKAELEVYIKEQLKNTVVGFEATQALEDNESGIETARQVQRDAEELARTTAEADINL